MIQSRSIARVSALVAVSHSHRIVIDDDMAGKGTKTARNASTVDGWNCVGNPAGIYSETGVLSYCESPPNARIEITK